MSSAEVRPTTVNLWVTMEITNYGSIPIVIKEVVLAWGKLYKNDNKDDSVEPDVYKGHVIAPGDVIKIASCGKQGTWTGTEGNIKLGDTTDGDQLFCTLKWDCPWLSSSNSWTVDCSNPKFIVESKGANLKDGALGSITISVMNKPDA
ncbi:aegerolysin type hemolysin [Trametes punicea]|nr:aegerolysin type hemolysin [Trametes punicea]